MLELCTGALLYLEWRTECKRIPRYELPMLFRSQMSCSFWTMDGRDIGFRSTLSSGKQMMFFREAILLFRGPIHFYMGSQLKRDRNGAK